MRVLRLLVTGATGFLGRNLLDLLERSGPGVEVHVLSRSTGMVAGRTEQAKYHQVDLLDPDAVTAAVEEADCTHLCHMGWVGAETPDRYGTTENQRWVDATKHLFNQFSAVGGARIVHVGSCIEYGNDIDGAQHEDSPLQSNTTYGQAKADVSRFVLNGVGETSAAVARVFFCYGRYEQPERLVPSIITSLLAGEPIDLTEGRQRRDYIDARDVAQALIELLNSDADGAFNVGSGTSVEVRRVAEILGEGMGRSDLLRFGARPEGADTAAEILADTDRIRSLVGWEPTIGLEDGLQDTLEWWRNAALVQR